MNEREIKIDFLMHKRLQKCRYQANNGLSFIISNCDKLELGKYYTIVGKASTVSDNKIVYRDNFDLSSISLNNKTLDSFNFLIYSMSLKITVFVEYCRLRFLFVVDSLFGLRAQALIKSLFLGTRVIEMDKSLKDQISRIGLAHMVAVSGFHLNLVYALLQVSLGGKLKRKMYRLVIILFLLIYVALVGSPLSVLRAFLMLLFSLMASMFFYKQYNNLFSLFLAFFLMSFSNMSNVFDVGLQLSFLATFGVLLGMNYLKIRDKNMGSDFSLANLGFKQNKMVDSGLTIISSIKGLFLASFSAQAATLPIVINNFAKYQIFSLLSSILFSSFIALLMTVVFYLIIIALPAIDFVWVFVFIVQPFVWVFNLFLDYFFYFFDWYVDNFSQVLSFNFRFSILEIFGYYFILLLLYFTLINRETKHEYIS